jgi:hypothetical protein
MTRKAIVTILSMAAILSVALAQAGCKDSNTLTGYSNAATPTVPAGYSVSGTVTASAGGQGVSGARVFAVNGTVVRSATTAGDGNYSISGIPAGIVTVEADHPEYLPAPTQQVTVPPSATGVDFHLRPGQ